MGTFVGAPGSQDAQFMRNLAHELGIRAGTTCTLYVLNFATTTQHALYREATALAYTEYEDVVCTVTESNHTEDAQGDKAMKVQREGQVVIAQEELSDKSAPKPKIGDVVGLTDGKWYNVTHVSSSEGYVDQTRTGVEYTLSIERRFEFDPQRRVT